MKNVDGGTTTVYVAAFLLARSRYKYAECQSRPFTSVDLVNICHNCFRYFGGMPQEMVFDQDSIVCVSENASDIIYTYEFEKFRQECKMAIYMCRGADPESKGKIENTVKYIKGNFLSNRLYVDDGILKVQLNGIHPNNPVTYALRGNAYTSVEIAAEMSIPSKDEGWAGFGIGRSSWNGSVWADGYYLLGMYNSVTGKAEMKIYNPTYGFIAEADLDYEVNSLVKFRMEVLGKNISVYRGEETTPFMQAYASDYEGGFVALCNYAAKNLYDNFSVQHLEDPLVWDEPYADDFSADTGNWINVSDAMGSFTIADGALTAAGSNGAHPEQVALKNRAYRNMDLSVDLTMPDSTVGWSSVSFGRANWNDTIWAGGYFVTVSHNASTGLADLVLWKANADASGGIAAMGQASTADAVSGVLTLRIVVNDGEISVYTGSGSTPLITAKAEDYAGGYLTLCSYMSQNSFDNFRIGKPSPVGKTVWDEPYGRFLRS